MSIGGEVLREPRAADEEGDRVHAVPKLLLDIRRDFALKARYPAGPGPVLGEYGIKGERRH